MAHRISQTTSETRPQEDAGGTCGGLSALASQVEVKFSGSNYCSSCSVALSQLLQLQKTSQLHGDRMYVEWQEIDLMTSTRVVNGTDEPLSQQIDQKT